jgi:hypothetical protein
MIIDILKILFQSCHNKITLIVILIRDHIDDLSLLLSKSVVLNLFKSATPLNNKKKFATHKIF